MKLPRLLATALLLSIAPAYSNDNNPNPPPTDPPPPVSCSGGGVSTQSLSWWHAIGDAEYKVANDLLGYSRVGALVGSKLGQPPSTFSQVYKAFNGGSTTKLMLNLCLDQKTITAAIADPSVLSLNTANTNAKVIKGTANVIRQVKTDNMLTDVSVLPSGAGYTIRSWNLSTIPALQSSSGFYVLPTQTPCFSATFSNPDHPSDLHHIDVTEIDNSGGSSHTITKRYEETYLAGNSAFPDTFTITTYAGASVSGNPVRKEVIQYSNRGVGTTSESAASSGTRRYWDYNIERTISEAALAADGTLGSLAVISHTFEQFADFSIYGGSGPDAGGSQGVRRLISETRGYGSPGPVTTTYTYVNNPTNPLLHGRLQSRTLPDGSWEYHEYSDRVDSPIAVETVWSSWKDVAMSDKDNACKTITTIEPSKTTSVTTIAGQLVASSQIQLETLPDNSLLTTSSTWTGTEWATTVSCRYPQDGTLTSGRIKWTENADGTATSYTYTSISNGYKVTTSAGAGNRNGITDGIRTLGTYNLQNILLSSQTNDILSGLQLDMVVYSNLDNGGRPQRIDYPLDGTYEINQYSCCGLGFTRDRTGGTSTYSRDVLKRIYRVSTQRSSAGPVVYQTIATNGLTTTWGSYSGSTTLFRGEITTNLAGDAIQRKSPDADGDGNSETTTTTTTYPSAGGKIVTVTKPDGSTSISAYFKDGQMKSVSGTAVHAMSYDYGTHALNGGGIWSKTTAANGVQWSKSYFDGLKRSFRLEYPDGAASREAYHPFNAALGSRGKKASSTDPDGITTSFAYNAQGELTTTTQPMPGNQQQVSITNSDVVNDPTIGVSNRQTSTINGALVSTSLRQAKGYATKSVTLSGTTTNVRTVPNNGAWTITNTDPDGTSTVATYVDGLMTKQQSFGTDQVSITSTTMTYDAFGRALTSTDSRTGTTTMGAYLQNGSLTSVTDPGNRTTAYTYDVMGRRLSTVLPDNSVIYTSYTPKGEVEATWGSQTYPVFYSYDALGRAVNLRTKPILDANGKPTDVGGSVTTWNYHAQRGWLVSKLDAANEGAVYKYTPAGRRATRTWARTVNGQPLITTYTYDAGLLVATGYSDNTPGVTITYDNFGRQLTQSNGLAQSSYSYDSATLQLTKETISYNLDGQPGFEFSRMINRSNDSLLRPTGFQLDGSAGEPSAVFTDARSIYGYSATSGRLETVSDGTASFRYDYLANSNLISQVTATAGAVHTVTNTWEASRNVLASKINEVNVGTHSVPSSFAYGINSIGQRETLGPVLDNFDNPVSTYTPKWAWNYNPRGEVIEADDQTGTNDRAYKFDAIGNREKTVNGLLGELPADPNWTANLLNQYTVANGVTLPTTPTPAPNDPDGNLRFDGGVNKDSENREYVWDAENRLIAVKRTSDSTTLVIYAYDHHSRLISSTQSPSSNPQTTLYLYDGWNRIAEYSGTTLKSSYLWGMDLSGTMQGSGGVGGVGGLLAVCEHTGTVQNPVRTPFYPTYDGNGNIGEYLDATGTVRAHYEYETFGNVVVSSGDKAADFAYRFSTKPLDSVTGWYYYGYRFYDPLTGRWPSRDPIEEEGGVNLYGFVGNNVVNKWDYLGLATPGWPQWYHPTLDINGRWHAPSGTASAGQFVPDPSFNISPSNTIKSPGNTPAPSLPTGRGQGAPGKMAGVQSILNWAADAASRAGAETKCYELKSTATATPGKADCNSCIVVIGNHNVMQGGATSPRFSVLLSVSYYANKKCSEHDLNPKHEPGFTQGPDNSFYDTEMIKSYGDGSLVNPVKKSPYCLSL